VCAVLASGHSALTLSRYRLEWDGPHSLRYPVPGHARLANRANHPRYGMMTALSHTGSPTNPWRSNAFRGW